MKKKRRRLHPWQPDARQVAGGVVHVGRTPLRREDALDEPGLGRGIQLLADDGHEVERPLPLRLARDGVRVVDRARRRVDLCGNKTSRRAFKCCAAWVFRGERRTDGYSADGSQHRRGGARGYFRGERRETESVRGIPPAGGRGLDATRWSVAARAPTESVHSGGSHMDTPVYELK